MIVKIENPRFSYVGNNIVSASSEVAIYADEGIAELYRKRIVVRANLSDTTVDAQGKLLWKVNIEKALIKQAQEVIDIYAMRIEAISSAWTTTSGPEEALDQLASEIEAKLTY